MRMNVDLQKNNAEELMLATLRLSAVTNPGSGTSTKSLALEKVRASGSIGLQLATLTDKKAEATSQYNDIIGKIQAASSDEATAHDAKQELDALRGVFEGLLQSTILELERLQNSIAGMTAVLVGVSSRLAFFAAGAALALSLSLRLWLPLDHDGRASQDEG